MVKESAAKRGIRVIREIAAQSTEDDILERAEGIQQAPAVEATQARIAEIAYRKAAERGFAPGGELDDWLAAEREVLTERDAAGMPV